MRPASELKFAQIYRWPSLLIVLSLFGLISALVGDGVWDSLSWLALGIPLAVIAWSLLRNSEQAQKKR